MTNQEWQFVARPTGLPSDECYKLVDIPAVSQEDVKDGEVLVEMKALSVDPYLRVRMDKIEGSYIQSFELGKPMENFIVAEVVASKAEKFPVGSHLTGLLPFRKQQIVPTTGLTPITPSEKLPLTYYLGVLGLTGLSAYLPIVHIGKPKEGESVFVTGAAGAVGMAAIQIFKKMGCKVYGCAGSDDKVALLRELGVEDAFNYKTVTDYTAKLKEMIPNGIDIYFDNVGGPLLDAVLANIANNARIIACGAISQYNNTGEPYGLKNASNLIFKCGTMQGFIVFQWLAEYEEAIKTLAGYVLAGDLTVKETVLHGFAEMPKAMTGLLTGANTGKMVVTV